MIAALQYRHDKTESNNNVHVFHRLYGIFHVKRAVIDEKIPNPPYNQIRYPLNLLHNIPLCFISSAHFQAMASTRRPFSPALFAKIYAKCWCNSIPCCVNEHTFNKHTFDNIKHLCDPWISAPLFEATASCQLPINQVRLNSHPIPCNCCVILVRRLLGFMLLKFAMILQCMISFSFIEFIFNFAGKYPHLCVCSDGKHIHEGQNAQYDLG